MPNFKSCGKNSMRKVMLLLYNLNSHYCAGNGQVTFESFNEWWIGFNADDAAIAEDTLEGFVLVMN